MKCLNVKERKESEKNKNESDERQKIDHKIESALQAKCCSTNTNFLKASKAQHFQTCESTGYCGSKGLQGTRSAQAFVQMCLAVVLSSSFGADEPKTDVTQRCERHSSSLTPQEGFG